MTLMFIHQGDFLACLGKYISLISVMRDDGYEYLHLIVVFVDNIIPFTPFVFYMSTLYFTFFIERCQIRIFLGGFILFGSNGIF